MISVAEQHRFNKFVERTRAWKRWKHIYFKKPWLKVSIYENVKAIYFIAFVSLLFSIPHRCGYCWLTSHESFQTNVFDFCKYLVVVDTHFFVLILQLSQTPFEFHSWVYIIILIWIVFFISCIPTLILFSSLGPSLRSGIICLIIHTDLWWSIGILDISLSFLIDRVICQMHKPLLKSLFVCWIWLCG